MDAENIKQSLPENLAQAVADYVWRQIHIGQSTAQVFRLASPERNCYLKIAPRTAFAHSLLQEKLKLDWLKNRLPVPEVLLFAADEKTVFFCFRKLPVLMRAAIL